MLALAFASVLVAAAAAESGLVAPSFVRPPALVWPAAADPELGPRSVELELRVGAGGEVLEVRLLRGEEPFAAAAQAAAASLALAPATEGGVPVEAWVPLTLTFVPPARALEGVVRVAGGGAAGLGRAEVRVDGVLQLTDAAGAFVVRGLAPGRHRVEVVAAGYRVDPAEVEVREGEVTELALWAVPLGVDPGIVGSYRRGRVEVGRRSLDAAELRVAPGSMGDPLRALSNLPGTTRPPLESGWLLVRGGAPEATAVFLDGVRVPLVYHLGGFTSVLHPAFVERVDFLPGGGSARYGHALAGTVDVVSREPPDTVEVRGGANLVFAGAYASVPVGPVRVQAAARRSYLDAVAGPFLPAESAGVIPRFWDWQARVDAGPVEVFGIGYADTVTLPTPEADVTLDVGTERVHARLELPVGGSTLVVAPAFGWELLRLDADDTTIDAERERTGGALRVELADAGTAPVGATVGLDLEGGDTHVHYGTVSRGAWSVSPDVYADVRVGTDAQVVAGLRLDSLLLQGQDPRAALSPRLAGRLPLGARAGLEAEASGRHMEPTWELLVARPEGGALALDEAWGGSVGGWAGVGPVELSLEGYGRYQPVLAEIEADLSVDEGQGYAWGVELSGRLRVGRVSADARLAYGESRRREGPDSPWRPSAYDQPWTFGTAAVVDLGRAWTVSGRFRFGSGFPADEDPLPVVDALTLETVEVDVVDGRAESFYALDLKVSKRVVLRTWRLDVYLDVQNVTNHRVPEPFITGMADVAVGDMGFGLVVLPIFGVEAAWGGDPRRP